MPSPPPPAEEEIVIVSVFGSPCKVMPEPGLIFKVAPSLFASILTPEIAIVPNELALAPPLPLAAAHV